ncbi:uncharacterized protein LOC111105405 [Crassostrea virginica]|uniref:Uncharacterized protein LOC111105405 n=1 Tax=Crassostrea virginica TaxID=6565 RepID=A0A8B8AVT4_CRAVI|nr:uncharacterized protein LOC111105405 [Crassostrea virginica]XP_022295393.1 uncharacterized protein LOC111105405 [Crassostrea virginica]
MDLGSVTATIWYYVTWPLSYVNQSIKQPLLGFILGWAAVWTFLHIGNKIVFYLAVQLLVFLALERTGLITFHWRRLSELMRRQGVTDPAGLGVSALLDKIRDFMSNNCLFFIGLVGGLVFGIII